MTRPRTLEDVVRQFDRQSHVLPQVEWFADRFDHTQWTILGMKD